MSSDRTVHFARLGIFAGAWLLMACLVVQLFLVGLDVFAASPDEVGTAHRDFAYLYGWLTPALVLLAMLGRAPRWFTIETVALLVLFAIQTYLPSLQDQLPLLAATHAINALAVVSLAAMIAWRSRDLLEQDRSPRGT